MDSVSVRGRIIVSAKSTTCLGKECEFHFECVITNGDLSAEGVYAIVKEIAERMALLQGLNRYDTELLYYIAN